MQGWESPEPKIVIWQWTKDCDLIGQRKIVISLRFAKRFKFPTKFTCFIFYGSKAIYVIKQAELFITKVHNQNATSGSVKECTNKDNSLRTCLYERWSFHNSWS